MERGAQMKFAGVLWLSLFIPAVAAAQAVEMPDIALTQDEIRTAIALGQSSSEIPRLRVGKRATLIKSAIAVQVGAASTPYMRIALAAREAKAKYRVFSEADVTKELAGNFLLLMIHPQPMTDKKSPTTSPETILALPKGSIDPADAVRPIWTQTENQTLQNLFGAQWTESTMFAAFPPEVLNKNLEFVVIYKEKPYMGAGATKQEIRAEVIDKVVK
jgi:hypothetical protein